MSEYDEIRARYKPDVVKYLLIAESPPPGPGISSSRQFYRAEYQKPDDRLYANTMRAVFELGDDVESKQLEAEKLIYLQRFQLAGFYMLEALQTSMQYEVTKQARRVYLSEQVERLIVRVGELASAYTKLILIKSNVFVVMTAPLRAAGYAVLNTALLDYPGRFNQADYRAKLSAMICSSDG